MAAGDRAQVLASLADILLAGCRAEGPEAYSLLVCASAAGLGYRFRHEMVGEVLRQSLSPALRRFLTEKAELARAALGQQKPRSTSGFDTVDHPST